MLVTICIAFGDRLNLKEKVFASFALMAKATVQAALGPVALESVRRSGLGEDEKRKAENVLLICILSIVLTAPVGAVIISLLGPRLLTKAPPLSAVSQWRRRSHRPSIRDISIIDEEEELESSEDQKPPTVFEEVEIQNVQNRDSNPGPKESGGEAQENNKF